MATAEAGSAVAPVAANGICVNKGNSLASNFLADQTTDEYIASSGG